MASQLSITGLVSGIIAFSSSWTWLILNINQPNHSSSETIDEERRINAIQDFLTISWLGATLLTIVITILVLKNRNPRTEDTQDNAGKFMFVGLAFIVTNPHFTYVFLIIMLDII